MEHTDAVLDQHASFSGCDPPAPALTGAGDGRLGTIGCIVAWTRKT
jgi:hypothetical protein